MQRDQSLEFCDWREMIVDPQVDGAIAVATKAAAGAYDQQRGGLLPTTIATCGLGSVQGGEQAIDKRPPSVVFHHLRHLGYNCFASEDVSLTAEVLADDVPCPREALSPGEGRGLSAAIDDADLSHVATGVSGDQSGQYCFAAQVASQHAQSEWSEARIRERLRRDGTNARLSPRNDAANSEKARLHGYAPRFGCRVVRYDRERGDDPHGVPTRYGALMHTAQMHACLDLQRGNADAEVARTILHTSKQTKGATPWPRTRIG